MILFCIFIQKGYMKRILILTSTLLFTSFISAQEIGDDTTKNVIGTTNGSPNNKFDDHFNSLAKLLESKSFVIEANTLYDKWGNRYSVNSILNFVMVDSTQSIIQIGNNTEFGDNGVGGITAKGSISSRKLYKDEKHNTLSLRVIVISQIGACDVLIEVSTSGEATATISGLTSTKIILSGQIFTLRDSRVYVGNH